MSGTTNLGQHRLTRLIACPRTKSGWSRSPHALKLTASRPSHRTPTPSGRPGTTSRLRYARRALLSAPDMRTDRGSFSCIGRCRPKFVVPDMVWHAGYLGIPVNRPDTHRPAIRPEATSCWNNSSRCLAEAGAERKSRTASTGSARTRERICAQTPPPPADGMRISTRRRINQQSERHVPRR